MSHLFVVALGPVQSFIAAARKTRDLWYGSKLLSELSRKVAEHLKSQGATLVFPAEQLFEVASGDDTAGGASEESLAVANKIVTLVTGDPQALAQSVRKVVNGYLSDQCEQAISKAKPYLGDTLDDELMRLQVAAFPEVYCAWWPMNGSYAEARTNVERLLAGRKALRDFEPNPGKPGRPKSSLDGHLESVTHDTSRLSTGRLRDIGLKPGEELDGVSLIKRTNAEERFVSVSRVSADPFIRFLSKVKPEVLASLCQSAERLTGSQWVQRFAKEPRIAHYDAFLYDTQLYYEPPTQAEENDERKANPTKAEELVREAKNFFSDASAAGSPPRYYAVLAGDGDRMGKVLGSLGAKERHQEFSAKLASFAAAAADIVVKHYGVLVYSGGDDVLAFLPLDDALECADELRRKFCEVLEQYQDATFTCGIAICHYSEHLQNALRWAREAEKAAKNLRNALGIHLHTRTAGEEKVEVVASWAANPLENRWNSWIPMLRNSQIPDGAIYQLRELHREFRDSGITDAEVLRKEVIRIVGRKRAESGTKPLDDSAKKSIQDAIVSQAGDMTATLDNLDRFVSEMIIARHIAKAKDVVEKGK